ncbi:MAG: ATP-dependent Clp protease ATP-binding subunit ClpC [Patescibacteria group bacterium]|nr:ATP-dependent Clp protease ATP-binding subunit ClpC [Patescibacteria group bacterium]
MHLEYRDPLEVELSSYLRSEVLGQEESIDTIAKLVAARLSQIGDREAPIAVLYLGGPTGVGKTETAHALADFFLGDPKGFTKIHGEDLQDHHTSRNLFGSPKSYVGYDDPPRLNEADLQSYHKKALEAGKTHSSVSAHSKFSIILIDEIDKIHPSICQNFLGIFDKGFFELPNGSENDPDLSYSKFTDFRQTIFILTSNAGEHERSEHLERAPMGFTQSSDHNARHAQSAEVVQRALRKKFAPEFIERIDTFLTYRPLTPDVAQGIVRKEIDRFRGGFLKRKFGNAIAVDVRPETVVSVAEGGLDPKRGARNLNRFVENSLIVPLRNVVMSGQLAGIPEGKTATLRVEGDRDSLSVTLLGLKARELGKGDIVATILEARQKTMVGRIEDVHAKIEAFRRIYELAFQEHFSMNSEAARLEKELLSCGIPQDEIELIRNDVVERLDREEREKQASEDAKDAGLPYDTPLPNAIELFYPISPEAIMEIIRFYIKNADKALKTPGMTQLRNGLVVLAIREACKKLIGKGLTKDQYDFVAQATHEVYLRMKAKTR